MGYVGYVPLLLGSIFWCMPLSAQIAEPWQAPYTGEDATGDHVIAFWNFDETGAVVSDVSGNGHDGALSGASRHEEGRFGGCIASFPGWPVEDARHAVVVPHASELSPTGAFTIDLWLCPKGMPEEYGESFLVDKKYVAHTDYQWILGAPNKQGMSRAKAVLGFGEDSETWWSEEMVALTPERWTHLAMTYDGAGTLHFFQDGRLLGGDSKPWRGPIRPGKHPLSLGDRIGSYYHGFPGLLDEVRISTDAREFRPITVTRDYVRTAYRRMEPAPTLAFRLTNNTRLPILELEAHVGVAGVSPQACPATELAPGDSRLIEYVLDTALRPDAYSIEVAFAFGAGDGVHGDRALFPVDIVGRKPPHRMPVIMWGVGGVESVLEQLPTLKEIGFSHCLGLRCDFQRIWDAGSPAQAVDDDVLAASCRMLDQALINDLGIIISVSPGRWLASKTDYLRVDAEGNAYERDNPCCNFPELIPFARNAGASLAHSYGAFPAFEAALINTEVRDGTQLCFHDHDRALYRAAAGRDYPDTLGTKNGIPYTDIAGFPADRVIKDDDELHRFYRWFWKEGDGWNAFHSAIHDGLTSTARQDLWSFFDPAVRVPPVWGSGGNVDILSHWTYSYPDPIRIGLATDELFAMARGGPDGQGVMKMTQIIWYRSQTAPADTSPDSATGLSPWEDRDPDANYITIAPAHLREAFWTKIARPVKGVMYHGWQSLVPVEGHSSYRHTHPETRHALGDLVSRVVRPLGPTLLQVPDAPSDVAFLESFSSVMFARRGTYGWGRSWAGDAYHALQYAHLQPHIVYEETILETGLDGCKILVMMDCDVLPASVVRKVADFRQSGGLIIGDDRLCPAVVPDIRLDRYERTNQADVDKAALTALAETLMEQLADRYPRYVVSSAADVLPYRRRHGPSDYIFAINDRREFGDYVGHHGLVMERGVNATAEFSVRRPTGFVYDLVEHRAIEARTAGGMLRWPATLEPGGGRLWLITETPIESLTIHAAKETRRPSEYPVGIVVTDINGAPMNAVIPMEVRIADPDGRPAEFSGYYGAVDGRLDLTLTLAINDALGVWTIEVRELASGRLARHFVRLI